MATNVDSALNDLLRCLNSPVVGDKNPPGYQESIYDRTKSPFLQRSGSVRYSALSDSSSRKSSLYRLTPSTLPKPNEEPTNHGRETEMRATSPSTFTTPSTYQGNDVRLSPIYINTQTPFQRTCSSFRYTPHSLRGRGTSFREDSSYKKEDERRRQNLLEEQEQRMNDTIGQRQQRRLRSGYQSMKTSRAASPGPDDTPQAQERHVNQNVKEEFTFLDHQLPVKKDNEKTLRNSETVWLETPNSNASLNKSNITHSQMSKDLNSFDSTCTNEEEEPLKPSVVASVKSGRMRRQNAASIEVETDIPLKTREIRTGFPSLDIPHENKGRGRATPNYTEIVRFENSESNTELSIANSGRTTSMRRPSDGMDRNTLNGLHSVKTINEEVEIEPSVSNFLRATSVRRSSKGLIRNTPNNTQPMWNEVEEVAIQPTRVDVVNSPIMRRPSEDINRTTPNNIQPMWNEVEEDAIQPTRVDVVKSPVMRRPSEESSSIRSPRDSVHEPSDSSSLHSVNFNENDYRPLRRSSKTEGRSALKTEQKSEILMNEQQSMQNQGRHPRMSTPKQIYWADDPTEGIASRSFSQMSTADNVSPRTRSFSMRTKNQPAKDMLDFSMKSPQLRMQTQSPVGDLKVNPLATSVRLINETSKVWFQPQLTRNEANQSLLHKTSGAFVIRKSSSKKDAFDLAIKVAKLPKYSNEHDVGDPNNLIRHFLIETSRLGVRLMGSETEPYFSSLTALIHQHCQTPLSLPCLLRIEAIVTNGDNMSGTMNDNEVASPTLSSITMASAPSPYPFNGNSGFSSKTDSLSFDTNPSTLKGSFFYLALVNVENMSGWAALDKTISSILQQIGNVRQTECSLWITLDGVTLTDKWRKIFFRQHFPASSIAYCEMDRRGRTWNSPELSSRGVPNAKIFGMITRIKPQGSPSHNQCIVMCECSPEQSAKPFMDAIFKMILAQS